LAPEYKLAAEKLAGMVVVGAVDCDAEENKGLCATYGIQGFPTIKVFSAGKKGMPSDFQGQRTAAAIVNEGISKVRSYLKKCVAQEFDDLVASNNKSVIVLVSEKTKVPVMFNALSAEFYDQVDFCFFKSSDAEFMKKVEITTFPSLRLFSKDKEPVVYDGPLKFKSIKEFLEPFAINRKPRGNNKKNEKKEAPKEKTVCNFF
jgi:protein disulfide-isomerase A6